MTTAREFLEQLQQGVEQTFPEQIIKFLLPTRDVLARALIAAIPPLEPLKLPLLVNPQEFWFLFGTHAHHATVAAKQEPGGRTLDVLHDAFPLTALLTTHVRTRFQATSTGTHLVSATLTFAFATGERFEVSGDYQEVDDRTTLTPRAILAFAQSLLVLAPHAARS